MNKIISLLLLSILLYGCATPLSSSYVNLSVASDREQPDGLTVLQRGVIGEDCPSGIGAYGSYSTAVDNALQKVDGANVLINAKFSRKEMPIMKICVKVEGDAAKL